MKIRRSHAALAAAFSLAVVLTGPASAVEHANQTVLYLYTPDYRPCTLFTLSDNLPADPVNGSDNWYGIPQASSNYKERMAMLYMAKATGAKITVVTDGTVNSACGKANISTMYMP